MGLLLGGHIPLVAVAVPTKALDTTITSGSENVTTPQKTPYEAFGFDAGADEYTNAVNFGSIANDIYTDGDSISRKITSCYWIDETNSLFFALDTLSIPDSDATFFKLVIDGVDFTRADAAAAHNNDGGTIWDWDNITVNPFIGANPDDFEVFVV